MTRFHRFRPVTFGVAVTVVLALQSLFMYGFSVHERYPSPPDLDRVPRHLGSWTMTGEYPLQEAVVAYLRPDRYVSRTYVSDGSSASLLVAYFKSLKSGYGPHAPRHCLPGAGWEIISSRMAAATSGEGFPERTNEYILAKQKERILAVYWYQNGERTWSTEMMTRVYVFADLIRHARSDVALIRITVPVGESAPTARRLAESLVQAVYPVLKKEFGNAASGE